MGYSLTLVKATQPSAPRFDEIALLALVRDFVPSGRITSHDRLEVVVHLPGSDLRLLQSLLLELEERLETLGVVEYGAACTTLEDVFLAINNQAMERLARQQKEAEIGGGGAGGGGGGGRGRGGVSVFGAGEGMYATRGQFASAGLEGRVDGDTSGEREGGSGENRTQMEVREAMQEREGLHNLQRGYGLVEEEASQRSLARGGGWWSTYRSLLTKRRLSAQRDLCTSCCQLLFPVLLVFFALAILNASSAIVDIGPALELSPAGAFHSNEWKGPPIASPVPLLLAESNTTLALSEDLKAQVATAST